MVWLNFGMFFRNGLSFRSTTCLPLIRFVLFSAAIANTSAAVPDRIRDCSVEMYSATGGALENSILIPGFSCWNLSITGFMVSCPSQEKNVNFLSLLPLLPEDPPQAASGRASATAARAATVRRSLIGGSLRKVGDMTKRPGRRGGAAEARPASVVTMADVARSAGVSTMTVSNVINGRPRVGAATRERVLATISELGYQVNLAARNLRAGRTGVVGLAVPELERPYFAQLAGRLADRFEAHGLRIVMERTGASREGSWTRSRSPGCGCTTA